MLKEEDEFAETVRGNQEYVNKSKYTSKEIYGERQSMLHTEQ